MTGTPIVSVLPAAVMKPQPLVRRENAPTPLMKFAVLGLVLMEPP